MALTTRPELAGSFGMVASTHWLATQTGMSVLERGGNAFDAAVAAGFVLQVVEPHLNGPGGDLPVVLWSAAEQRVRVVCGQGTAPAAATPEAFADLGLTAIPGTGLLPAVVPGAFGAWTLMLQRFGTWRLRDVLEPAIGYARDGAPVLPRVAASLEILAPMFGAEWPTSAATYLDGGRAPAAWTRLRLTALAETYQRIVADAEAAGGDREAQLEAARDAWYRGFVAAAVDRHCRTTSWLDTSGERHGGLLTGDDLAGWEPAIEEPVSARYRDVEVFKTGPWGQGPVFLQQLRMLDALGLPDALDVDDASWVHAWLEVAKLAFADRDAWYGDPRHADVPLADLLSDAYARQRAALVDPAKASVDQRPGEPGGRAARFPAALPADLTGSGDVPAAFGEGEPTMTTAAPAAERGDTCHLDVADRWGNLVSATPSGGWLQSSPVVQDLGFPLGTRGQMFWLEPGLPSTLRPGARPRTTLSPSLALRDGEPWLAFGTPGGDQQDQWSLIFALRAIHGPRGVSQSLQAALDAPMLQSEHMVSSFYPRRSVPGRAVLEDRWPAATVAELRRLGHDVELTGGWSLGRQSAVARDGEWLRAAADARGSQGYAAGR
jgi:gamma-glutamyltranspeptidase/glutathione hydrolase